jgi:hypothetical protein
VTLIFIENDRVLLPADKTFIAESNRF